MLSDWGKSVATPVVDGAVLGVVYGVDVLWPLVEAV